MPDDWIKLGEAVDLIMQRTGKNRRQTQAHLFELMRSQGLKSRMYDLKTGEDLGPLPPELIPPREH